MFTVKTYRVIIGEIVEGMVKEIGTNGLSMSQYYFSKFCHCIGETAYLHQALKELEMDESLANWEFVKNRAERVFIDKNDDFSVYCEILRMLCNNLIHRAKTKV
jgi:DNA-directed RNA polymerase subunit E'/Rpb7